MILKWFKSFLKIKSDKVESCNDCICNSKYSGYCHIHHTDWL